MKVQLLSEHNGANTKPAGLSTILFLAANAIRNEKLKTDKEYRVVHKNIRAATFHGQIRLLPRFAARVDDLLEALHEDDPSVLHFSGHGGRADGLYFETENGNSHPVNADGLGKAICAAGPSVKIVVLNACYSKLQADALVSHIPCVIGMPGIVLDEAAIIYSADFYRALAFGKSVAIAHQCGLAALALYSTNGLTRDVEQAEVALRISTPEMLTRQDIDANHIYIVSEPHILPVGGASPREVKVHLELNLDSDLETLDANTLATIIRELCRSSGAQTIRIICLGKGSVRLVISLDRESAETLIKLKSNGQLEQVCGLAIRRITELAQVETSTSTSASASVVGSLIHDGRNPEENDAAENQKIIQILRQTATLAEPPAKMNEDVESVLKVSSASSTPMTESVESRKNEQRTRSRTLRDGRRPSDPDSDILALCASHDMTAALRLLMQRHGTAVYRYCREALRDGTLAEDVQQQVFISAFRDLPRFTGRSTLRIWLFAIARNRVLDAAKSRRRERSRVEAEDNDSLVAPMPHPDQQIDNARMTQAVNSCLQKVPKHVLTALLLRFRQGFTDEEVAEICDQNTGALQAQIARTLPLLRSCVEEQLGSRL